MISPQRQPVRLLRLAVPTDVAGVPLHAALDSQALIVTDPDGTTIELSVATPGDPWRRDPSLVAFAAPLDI